MHAMIDLSHIQYLVDDDGRATAAVVDIALWRSLLDLVETEADVELAEERLATWSTKKDWTPWDEGESEEQ
jgi:hypothetical protein